MGPVPLDEQCLGLQRDAVGHQASARTQGRPAAVQNPIGDPAADEDRIRGRQPGQGIGGLTIDDLHLASSKAFDIAAGPFGPLGFALQPDRARPGCGPAPLDRHCPRASADIPQQLPSYRPQESKCAGPLVAFGDQPIVLEDIIGQAGHRAPGVQLVRYVKLGYAIGHEAEATRVAGKHAGQDRNEQGAVMSEFNPGTVVLVGGGPGDPDLITVGGLRAIQQADVVVYDHLAPLAVLAEARDDAELIDVGKIPRGPQTSQDDINALLITHAQAGRRVVRLKGGDNFLFGRGGEEAIECAAAGVAVRVIPGVTSALAAPALAGIPVTHRGLSQGVTVVSGHVPPHDMRSELDWSVLAGTHTTLVVLMGVKYLPEIVAELLTAGLAPQTPAAIVMRAASPQMRVLRAPIDQIVELAIAEGVEPPAITVIGAVAALELGLG